MEERWSASTLTHIKSVTSCLPIGCHRGSFEFDFACSAWHQLINVCGHMISVTAAPPYGTLLGSNSSRGFKAEASLRHFADTWGWHWSAGDNALSLRRTFRGATSTDWVCFFTSEGLSLWEILYRGGCFFLARHRTLSIFDNVYF